MKLHIHLFGSGIKKAFQADLLLMKIILPVTLIVVALDKFALLVPVARWFAPALHPFGLPGEAALALILGFCLNIYAAIGAITALNLTGREITILAVMILTSHSLFMEGPVLKATGLSPVLSTTVRIITALLFGLLVNGIYTIFGG